MPDESTLTQEELLRHVQYDPDTGVFWRNGKPTGNIQSNGRVQIFINGKLWQAHRLAWLYVYGTWPKKFLDHKNRNSRDNRIANLREATQAQNAQNVGLRANNKSGVTGISYQDAGWKARIGYNGKIHYLGWFKDFDDAVRARKEAEQKYHGEYSSPGVPVLPVLDQLDVLPGKG